MHPYRSHTCGELRREQSGETVRISGWVHRKRDHGGVIFIDARDQYGLTQVVVNPDNPHFTEAERVRNESVITVTGKVVPRPGETVNRDLGTGEIEVVADGFHVESVCRELPFPVNQETDAPEEMRLKHRYLDLRRPRLTQNILLRSKTAQLIRDHLSERGFTEIQTPILTSSSPEGARDFLVPSRLHPGKFYALPQAPQQFKQLLMVSGVDKYFQIAPCFRDEDSRADRSPGEFYQLDLEMAYITQDDLFAEIEPLMRRIFEELSTKTIVEQPFPRIPYKEAISKYGTDKPDLRYGLEMVDLTEVFKDSELRVFSGAVASGGVVKTIPAPGAASRPRKFFDDAEAFAKSEGAKGLAWIAIRDGEMKGPIVKFLSEAEKEALIRSTNAKDGDALFFAAGSAKETNDLLAKVRVYLANALDAIDSDKLAFCWIVDYPMYEWDEDRKKIYFSHNPF